MSNRSWYFGRLISGWNGKSGDEPWLVDRLPSPHLRDRIKSLFWARRSWTASPRPCLSLPGNRWNGTFVTCRSQRVNRSLTPWGWCSAAAAPSCSSRCPTAPFRSCWRCESWASCRWSWSRSGRRLCTGGNSTPASRSGREPARASAPPRSSRPVPPRTPAPAHSVCSWNWTCPGRRRAVRGCNATRARPAPSDRTESPCADKKLGLSAL